MAESEPPRLLRRALAEWVGTFLLVLIGCGAVMVDSVSGGALGHAGVSLAFGLVVGTMVLSVGHVCGAHLNPAVTLAFVAIRRFPAAEVPAYIGAQVTGALAAAAVLRGLLGEVAHIGATLPSGSSGQSFAVEVLLSLALMFVIASVATDVRAAGGMAGLAIGGAVAMGALMGGPISGASMNPARSLGPALISGELGHLWVYLTAPVLGTVLGALAYEVCRDQGAPSASGETR